MLSEAELDGLLSSTSALFANIHLFDIDPCDFGGKSHTGCSIAHQDLIERRDDFIRELRNTMSSWVYSKARYADLFNEALKNRGMDPQNASSQLQELVRSKFRRGFPAGQFGELLLFNLIQRFFKAPPVLRKMALTTNPKIERHGADAVHFRAVDSKNVVYLGEAKTYSSKYAFNEAVRDAVDSALASFVAFQNELNLYVYDDLVADELRPIAKLIKDNSLPDYRMEVVCVVSYDENASKVGASKDEIHHAIEAIVTARLKKLKLQLGGQSGEIFKRIHFFFLPFWELSKVLAEFDK